MTEALLNLAATCLLATLAYRAGKTSERLRVHGWLVFLHDEEVSTRELSRMVAAGQHYDWEG